MRRLAFLALIFWALIFTVQASATPAPLLVVLDAGHGGDDVGAVATLDGKLVTEKELTLAIVGKTAVALNAKGIKTLLTRDSDKVVLLDKRTDIANKAAKNARRTVFVSIHINSTNENQSSGIETYVFNATTNEAATRLAEIENGSNRVAQKGVLSLILSDLTATANFAQSVKLACATHEHLFPALAKTFGSEPGSKTMSGPAVAGKAMSGLTSGPKNRGVKPGLFYVLMGIETPAILIEAGFASNSAELALLTNPKYQEAFASGIANGIEAWHKLRTAKKPSNILAHKNSPKNGIAPGHVSGIQKNSSLCP